jgi:hypothetical protein
MVGEGIHTNGPSYAHSWCRLAHHSNLLCLDQEGQEMINWLTRSALKKYKPIPLMEKPTKMSDIQTNVKAAGVRAIAAYDKALATINMLSGEVDAKQLAIESLTITVLELTEMLDAKFPVDGGSTGDVIG